MRSREMKSVAVFLLLVLARAGVAADVKTPAELYGELFERVQLERVYPDSKTFVDALPVRSPDQIMAEYRESRGRPEDRKSTRLNSSHSQISYAVFCLKKKKKKKKKNHNSG